MSLAWGTYSIPDIGSSYGYTVRIAGQYDFSATYEDNASVSITVDYGSSARAVSGQQFLDLVAGPIHDALIAAGWYSVSVQQSAAGVTRTATATP